MSRSPTPAGRLRHWIGIDSKKARRWKSGSCTAALQNAAFEKSDGLSLERLPFAEFLQLEMADGDFHAVSVAQALG